MAPIFREAYYPRLPLLGSDSLIQFSYQPLDRSAIVKDKLVSWGITPNTVLSMRHNIWRGIRYGPRRAALVEKQGKNSDLGLDKRSRE
jgi:hypothetical protein